MTRKIKIIVFTLLVILPMLVLLSACGDHTHGDFTDETVVTPATCTKDGVGSHACGECGERIEFVIPKTGHTEVIDAGKDYTCTEDGVTEGKHCSVCHEVLLAQVVLPAAHRPSDWQVTKPASCEIDGSRIKTCTVCNEQTHSEVITKLGHAESDWDIIKAATCENEGKKQTTCLTCKTVMQSVTIDALGHDKTDWIITAAATCTSSGLKHKGCTRCSETFDQTSINALGHLCTDTVVEPTCVADGYTAHNCTRCTYSYTTDTVDKLGHNYSASVVQPTCTEKGYTHHTCTRCAVGTDGHDYKDSYVNPNGHQYDNGTVTAPTCLDRGYTTYTCIKCTADTTGHSYVDNYVNPLSHQYDNGVVTAPTCLDRGYTTYTCIRCEAGTDGHSYVDDYVNPLDHKYDNGIVTAPTCTAQGYMLYTCIRCAEGTEGHSYKDSYTDPLGHQYIEKVDENPSCEKAGSKHNECIRCATVEPGSTKAIPATGHSISPSNETKDMGNGTTRTATVYRCAGCTDYVYVSKIVFNYSKPNADKRLNINVGWCYGMSVDYSDLQSESSQKNMDNIQDFRVDVTFSFKKHNSIFEKETFADIFITPTGEGVDTKLSYLEFIDKTSAVANSVGSDSVENDSAPWNGYVNFPTNKLKDGHVYFVFMNYNASSAYTIKSISATATFDFGEPTT